MLALLRALPDAEFSPRTYYISSGDAYSRLKAAEFENARGNRLVRIETLPRARSVGQSWLTTPLTVAWSTAYCLWRLGVRPICTRERLPFVDVVLLNGPATCVPICACVVLLRVSRTPAGCLTVDREASGAKGGVRRVRREDALAVAVRTFSPTRG